MVCCVQERAIERSCGREQIGALRRYLHRLEASKRKALYGTALSRGYSAEVRINIWNKLVEEVVLEAACPDPRRIFGKIGRSKVYKESGDSVVVATHSRKDEDHWSYMSFLQQVAIHINRCLPVAGLVLKPVDPLVLMSTEEVKHRVASILVGEPIVPRRERYEKMLRDTKRLTIQCNALGARVDGALHSQFKSLSIREVVVRVLDGHIFSLYAIQSGTSGFDNVYAL